MIYVGDERMLPLKVTDKNFGFKSYRRSMILFRKLLHKNQKKEIGSIDAYAKDKQDATYNILMLGAGGSGKTTLMKHFEIACNDLTETKILVRSREDICRAILIDAYDLCKYNIRLNSKIKSAQDLYRLSSDAICDICHRISLWPAQFILEDPMLRLTENVCQDIAQLWSDKAMKETWRVRSAQHHMDNTPYYLDNPAHFIQEDYTPSYKEYLMYRDQTTGCILKKYEINDDISMQVTDLGGIRAERRKWNRFFPGNDLIIYMTQLTGYCQTLFEDHTKNRLDEEFELFSKTMSEELLMESQIILIFSKYDLFVEKLKEIPFTEYKPAFSEIDAQKPDKVFDYIRDEYMKRFEQARSAPKSQLIYLVLNLITVPVDIIDSRHCNLDASDDISLVFGYCKYQTLPTDVMYIVHQYYHKLTAVESVLNVLGSN